MSIKDSILEFNLKSLGKKIENGVESIKTIGSDSRIKSLKERIALADKLGEKEIKSLLEKKLKNELMRSI